MDEATLKRAAEPFFTTKGSGKGTGLGLSMVDGVAAQSGGAMRVTSRLSVGTRVEIWLPVGEAAAVAASSPPGSSFDDAPGPYRVMVVDDDPLFVSSTTAMLEDLGHLVIEAMSGARALDMLRLGANVDVVVTDHAMPGMTGSELARQIRQQWPSLPIILATGYAELRGSRIASACQTVSTIGAGSADRQGTGGDGGQCHSVGLCPSRLNAPTVSRATA